MAVDGHRQKEHSLCQMALRVDRIADTVDSSECSPNYFCISSSLIFAGSVLLCVLGFTVVLPYEATSDWPEVTCRVVSVEYNTSICACRNQPPIFENCYGKNPCLRVTVAFNQSHLVHNFTGRCSSVEEGTSVIQQSSFGFDDPIVSTSSGFSEFPEAVFRRLAEEESTMSEGHSSSTNRPIITGLGLLSLIFERTRPTHDLTIAPAPSVLKQSTSDIVQGKSDTQIINKTAIIHHDLEMRLSFPYYTASKTNPIFIEARLFRSWYEA